MLLEVAARVSYWAAVANWFNLPPFARSFRVKLHQLAIGARFEYEGKIYSKTGPISAAGADGGSRLIPRSATLKPLAVAVSEAAPGSAGRRLDPAAVRRAFDAFHEAARKLVPPARHDELAAARQAFLAHLE